MRSHDPNLGEMVLTDVRSWDWPTIDSVTLHTITYAGATMVPWYGLRWDTPTNLQQWMIPVAGAAGMLTPSYRADQIALDLDVFRYAAVRGLNFYVRQEIGIDAIGDHTRIRDAWITYLSDLCREAYKLNPNAEVLWSPYAWDAWAIMTSTRKSKAASAMSRIVSQVKSLSGTKGVTIIDIQDGRGAQPTEPQTDAVNWYNLIKNCGAMVRLNAEWFKQNLTPQDKSAMEARLAYYANQNVPVGCCWEARYWLPRIWPNH